VIRGELKILKARLSVPVVPGIVLAVALMVLLIEPRVVLDVRTIVTLPDTATRLDAGWAVSGERRGWGLGEVVALTEPGDRLFHQVLQGQESLAQRILGFGGIVTRGWNVLVGFILFLFVYLLFLVLFTFFFFRGGGGGGVWGGRRLGKLPKDKIISC
jgi:disulfide bond formation protein DsbB